MTLASARRRQGLFGAAAMIAVITLFSRALGLARWLVQAATVGPGTIGDLYNGANLIPNVLFETAAGGALAGSLIPVLVGPIAKKAQAEIRQIVGAAFGWTLAVLVPLGLLLALLADPVAAAMGAEGPGRAAARFFILVFAVQIPMYGVTVLAYATLQAHERFFWPAFAPILSSTVMIASYGWYGVLAAGEVDNPAALAPGAITVLAWGTTAGVVAMCLPALIALGSLGLVSLPRFAFPNQIGPTVRRLAVAGAAGVAAQQIASLVAMLVAQRAHTWTVYQYAQQAYLLPYAILVVPVVTSVFPQLSGHAEEKDSTHFHELTSRSTRSLIAVAGLGAAVLAAVAPPVGLVFESLAVDGAPEIGGPMTTAVTLLAPGLIGLAGMFHLSRVLLAAQHSRGALLGTTVGWVAVAIGTVTGFFVVGSDGPVLAVLAGATSVGMLIGAVVSGLWVRRVVGGAALRGLGRTTGVVVAAGVIGAVVGRWVADSVVLLLSTGLWTAIGAGLGGSVVALVTVIGILYLGDRPTIGEIGQAVQGRRRSGGAVARP